MVRQKNPHFERSSVEIGQRRATLTDAAGDRNFQHKRTRYVTWLGTDFSIGRIRHAIRRTNARESPSRTQDHVCTRVRPTPIPSNVDLRATDASANDERDDDELVADVSVQWDVGSIG